MNRFFSLSHLHSVGKDESNRLQQQSKQQVNKWSRNGVWLLITGPFVAKCGSVKKNERPCHTHTHTHTFGANHLKFLPFLWTLKCSKNRIESRSVVQSTQRSIGSSNTFRLNDVYILNVSDYFPTIVVDIKVVFTTTTIIIINKWLKIVQWNNSHWNK